MSKKETIVGIDELYHLHKKSQEEKNKAKTKDGVFECYFDGACSDNPGGKMGMGMVIVSPDGKKEIQKSIPEDSSNSNNVAEYLAFIGVLNYLFENVNKDSVVNIYGDSKLVVSQATGRWKIKAGLHDFYAKHAKKLVSQLRKDVKELNIEWLSRDRNTEADALSQQSIRA